MSGHTPGPWRAYDDTDTPNRRCEVVAMGKTICHIYNSVASEDAHNARLIAAAPDMLTALRAIKHRALCSSFDIGADIAAIVQAALVKATGESA